MASRSHIPFLGVGLLLLLLGGCMLPLRPAPDLPELSRLEEGDIVVTFSGSLQGWVMAMITAGGKVPPHPASHAEMVLHDDRGNPLLAGFLSTRMDRIPAHKRFKRLKHVQVYRAKSPPADRKRAAASLRELLHEARTAAPQFDYSMRYTPGRRDNLFCAGVVNEAYRLAELPLPFDDLKLDPSAVADHFEDVLNMEISGLLDLNSIRSNPNFEHVLSWDNKRNDPVENERSRLVAQYLLRGYEQGWRIRNDDTLHLGLAFTNLPAPYRKLIQTRKTATVFYRKVDAMWQRMERRGKIKGMNTAEKNALLEKACDYYRDSYLYRHDPAGHRPGLRELPDATAPAESSLHRP